MRCGQDKTCDKKLKAKDKRTVTFTLIHRPLDHVASDVTQTDSGTEALTHEESVTTTQTDIDSYDRIDASGNEEL